MNKHNRKEAKSAKRTRASEILVGRTPNQPPVKNVPLLVLTLAAFVIWIGILMWMAITG